MTEKIKAALAKFYHSTFGSVFCFFHHLFNDGKHISERTVLFVAHPDDEVLFFHTVLKNEKPFVALMTTGTSLRRMKEFKKSMKHYGLDYTYFPLATRDKREELLLKKINLVLSRGSFEKAYTHGETGEYGHEMHIRVNRAVFEAFGGEIYTTVSESENASSSELSAEIIAEKEDVFKSIYQSQLFVLDMWQNWVRHEKHIKHEVRK